MLDKSHPTARCCRPRHLGAYTTYPLSYLWRCSNKFMNQIQSSIEKTLCNIIAGIYLAEYNHRGSTCNRVAKGCAQDCYKIVFHVVQSSFNIHHKLYRQLANTCKMIYSTLRDLVVHMYVNERAIQHICSPILLVMAPKSDKPSFCDFTPSNFDSSPRQLMTQSNKATYQDGFLLTIVIMNPTCNLTNTLLVLPVICTQTQL